LYVVEEGLKQEVCLIWWWSWMVLILEDDDELKCAARLRVLFLSPLPFLAVFFLVTYMYTIRFENWMLIVLV
jgi:hypothetical protein